MTNHLQSWEAELTTIDNSMLPKVLGDEMNSLAKVNQKLEEAQKKKLLAEKRIDEVLNAADEEIRKAAGVGKNKAKTHSIFGHELPPTNGARIEAVEKNLNELIRSHADGKKFEKQLAEVTGAVVASETAVLEVVKCQSNYAEATANALKLLYGLSAYSIASTQSIVTNLEAILSGAKKKELGEMAKQQMYLVMDQLKSQENLNTRIKKNESTIKDIKKELRIKSEIDDEQDRRLSESEKKDREQDEYIRIQEDINIEQQIAIDNQQKKDEEHDKRLLDKDRIDKRHDKELARQAKKDEEHDLHIKDIESINESQDAMLAYLKEKTEALESENIRMVRECRRAMWLGAKRSKRR